MGMRRSALTNQVTAEENIKKNKKESKDQESIQSSKTPDPEYQWESDNVTIRYNN